ncbi:MAG TPA: hypothetical protein VH678_09755 [Xanthobacteraceae bacterium]|jgi:hypothetical protein
MSFLTIPRTALRQQAASRPRRDRLLRWISNGVTALTTAIVVLLVAVSMVLLAMD